MFSNQQLSKDDLTNIFTQSINYSSSLRKLTLFTILVLTMIYTHISFHVSLLHNLTGGFGKSRALTSLWIAPVHPLPTNMTASCSLALTALRTISLQGKQAITHGNYILQLSMKWPMNEWLIRNHLREITYFDIDYYRITSVKTTRE